MGRVVRKGLSDEVSGRALYAVVETPNGDAYHLTIAAGVADSLRVGDLVSFGTKREPAVQPVDRHIAEVAAACRGVYPLAGHSDRQDDVTRLAARRLRDLERAGLVATRAPGNGLCLPTCSSSSRSGTERRRLGTGYRSKHRRSASTRRSDTAGRRGSTPSTRSS